MSDVLSLVLMTEVFVTLFVIMDPVGTIPIFLSLNRGRSAATLHRAAWQAVAVSFAVIVAFAFFGQQILGYLHISLPALQGAGGLLLLLVALELLTGKEQEATAAADVNVALVPLGTPMLAGPGAIVATMVFSQRVHELGQLRGGRPRRGARARGAVAGDAVLHPDPAADPRGRGDAGVPHRRPAAVGDRGAARRRRRPRVRRRRGVSGAGLPAADRLEPGERRSGACTAPPR